ncbi:hypothetical protein CHARACLAT_006177 [Characodon lateralis]|uniref:Uncharacterized protein n=1 Tax=Characodon lateralis TaxID=208331 RepID=A0ABU7CY78_9TELE|nr:hypothetical protein [Characodon lateralis]
MSLYKRKLQRMSCLLTYTRLHKPYEDLPSQITKHSSSSFSMPVSWIELFSIQTGKQKCAAGFITTPLNSWEVNLTVYVALINTARYCCNLLTFLFKQSDGMKQHLLQEDMQDQV